MLTFDPAWARRAVWYCGEYWKPGLYPMRPHQFESQLCQYFLAVWPWSVYLTSVSLFHFKNGTAQYLLPGLFKGINNRVYIKRRARWGYLCGVVAMKCPGEIPIPREPTSASWMHVQVTFTCRISGRGQRNILITPLQYYFPLSWISDFLYTSSAWSSLPPSSCSILRATAVLIISKSPPLLPPASQTWWVSSLHLNTPPSSQTPLQYSLAAVTPSPIHGWDIVIAQWVLVGWMIAMKLFRVNFNFGGEIMAELWVTELSLNSISLQKK